MVLTKKDRKFWYLPYLRCRGMLAIKVFLHVFLDKLHAIVFIYNNCNCLLNCVNKNLHFTFATLLVRGQYYTYTYLRIFYEHKQTN